MRINIQLKLLRGLTTNTICKSDDKNLKEVMLIVYVRTAIGQRRSDSCCH